jgi:tripartite-type tricarboxylate transporter receptor subunit TctC
MLPPAVPKDRIATIKSAFDKTLRDPEFLAEAKKARLGVAPISGDELTRRVNAFFNLPEDMKRKIKRVLYE